MKVSKKMYEDICHNINNPLTIITLMANSSINDKEDLKMITLNVARIAKYVKSLGEKVVPDED